MEHFQWKSKGEIEEYVVTHKSHIGEELADVLYWVLLMSHDLNIDIIKASEQKLTQNAVKYPIEKAKGKNLKYDKL